MNLRISTNGKWNITKVRFLSERVQGVFFIQGDTPTNGRKTIPILTPSVRTLSIVTVLVDGRGDQSIIYQRPRFYRTLWYLTTERSIVSRGRPLQTLSRYTITFETATRSVGIRTERGVPGSAVNTSRWEEGQVPAMSRRCKRRTIPKTISRAQAERRTTPIILVMSNNTSSATLLLVTYASGLSVRSKHNITPVTHRHLRILRMGRRLHNGTSSNSRTFIHRLYTGCNLPLYIRRTCFSKRSNGVRTTTHRIHCTTTQECIHRLYTRAKTPQATTHVYATRASSSHTRAFLVGTVGNSKPTNLSDVPHQEGVIIHPLLSLARNRLINCLRMRNRP